ncbi:MAG: hypothetical protein U9Q67_03795, partial [Patescibacteria group bacterium]|nr:hypothetical protein [Patescibacteria group bacterium]
DNYQEGVPLNKLIDSRSKVIEYNKITEEQLEDNQKMQESILKTDLMSRGFSEDEAKEEITLYFDNDISHKKSKQALGRLKTAEEKRLNNLRVEAEQVRLDEEKRVENAITEIKSNVESSNEIIPGISINKRNRDNIVEALTKVVDYDKNGTPLNSIMQTRSRNPLAFDKTIAYLYTLGVFNLDDGNHPKPDWSKINTKSKTKVVRELEQKFAKQKTFRPGKSGEIARDTVVRESFIKDLDVDKLR